MLCIYIIVLQLSFTDINSKYYIKKLGNKQQKKILHKCLLNNKQNLTWQTKYKSKLAKY